MEDENYKGKLLLKKREEKIDLPSGHTHREKKTRERERETELYLSLAPTSLND